MLIQVVYSLSFSSQIYHCSSFNWK